MSVVPNVANKKRKKQQESKPQSALNKCLNEKRRREQENIYIEELAELISASVSDMSSLSAKPDKCAILQETVNQIRRIKQEPGQSDELQQSEVSSSKPTILAHDIYGPLLLEALDGFLFVVNIDGKIEFVSENITSFLKYTQDEIVDEIIYNIIHPSDRARFSSNLLPMMSLGNGSNWATEPNGGLSKRGSFNCRFLMKPESADAASNMEDKQSSSGVAAQYENMQVSAVFFPFAKENREKDSEGQNRLACVARRIPPNEKSPTSLGVEQFTTRLDVTGKITAIDVSGVSAAYSQYLSKELVDCKFQDLCHPSDTSKFVQHIKDTLQASSNTTVVYKLRVGPDRYVPVQTKSKLFHFKQSVNEQEFIMSTHSIIRESDNTASAQADGNLKTSSTQPSLVSASTSSGGGSVIPSSSAGMAITVSSLSIPNSTYSNAFNTMSSATTTDLGLNDLMSDIFPNAAWNMDSSSIVQDSERNSPAPNVVCTMASQIGSASTSKAQSSQLPANSAFSPEVTTVQSMSGNSSPATPGRVPTPYSRGSFSPSPVQVISEKVSPRSGVSPKAEKSQAQAAAENIVNNIQNSAAVKQDILSNVQANQKLRNLLMQSSGTNNADMNSNLNQMNNQKNNSRDEDVVILNRGPNVFENRSQVPRPVAAVVGVPQAPVSGSNNILRELLNQDDDDPLSEGRSSFADRNIGNRMAGLLNMNPNKPEMDRQKRLSDNNMLRRLLNNNDENDTSSASKSEDIIHQLLKSEVSERTLQQPNRSSIDILNVSSMEDSGFKSSNVDASLASSAVFSLTEAVSNKRKAVSTSDFPNKRQSANHAHLAGQNPMLASMLAQTPRTPPSVPTSIVNTIMTQLPQERLPKNLEKKLIHTPYTTASSTSSAASTSTSAQAFSIQTSNRLLLASASVQQDVVTSDTRGHVTQHPTANLQVASNLLNKTSFTPQQQQSFLNRILSSSMDTNTLLSRSLSVPSTSMQQVVPNAFGIQFAHAASENSSRGLRDMLSDSIAAAAADDPNLGVAGTIQTTQSSDPGLAEILDQIYSLQEEMNVATTVGDEASDILKILEDVIDAGNASNIAAAPVAAAPPVTAPPTVQEISEKIAISAIQKQLMSFEGTQSLAPMNQVTLQNNQLLQTFSQAGNLPNTVVRKVAQVPVALTASSALSALQQVSNASQPPTYTNSLVTSRVRLPVVTPSGTIIGNGQQILGLTAVQRMGLQQNIGANVNQIRRSLIERKQKLYLEQKRLLEQQQKQQLTMQTEQPPVDVINAQGSSSFPENINDLLNNTVAPPNVALQRSTSISEAQLSPRFTNLIGQIPSPVGQPATPSQLSPNQRGNAQSPFSPLSQQTFASPTPPPVQFQQQQAQSRLSPHDAATLASFSQGTTSSHSSSPVPQLSGSLSPHLQLSPQQPSPQQQQQQQQATTVAQWQQRQAQNAANNLLQQNPMLNAQLSQTFSTNQLKLTAQQRQQLVMRSLPSPGSGQQQQQQNPRSSPFQTQPDGSFPPLSPAAIYQSQAQQQQQQQQQLVLQQQQQQQTQQQRIQRTLSGPARLAPIRNTQNQQVAAASTFPGTEPLLSPQPLQSPSFSQAMAVPVSSYQPTTVSAGGGLTLNVTQDGSYFTFNRQNLQVLATSIGERARLANNAQVSSDYIRQELRAIVGARAQQALPSQLQGLSTSKVTLASSLAAGGSISLNRQTLEELGLSIEQMPAEGQLNSQQAFQQSLMNVQADDNNVNDPNAASTSSRADEPKAADQKKSLLQQLLSEPT